MSYIEGQKLDSPRWWDLSSAQQDELLASLEDIIARLRSIPVPTSARIGSIDGERAPLAWVQLYSHPVPSFVNESSMNIWLADSLAAVTPHYESWEPIEFRLRSAPTPPLPKLVFTHGDLAARNIIIRDDGKLVGLVDWEWAGWYPEYFERVRCEFEVTARPDTLSKAIVKRVPDCSEEVKSLYNDLARDVCLRGEGWAR